MAEHLTEEQQVEALKKFWKENGTSIILGILIALTITFGWRFYKSYRLKTEEHASLVYQRLVNAAQKKDIHLIKLQASKLKSHYSTTPYADLGALTLAKQAVDQNKIDDAITALNWEIKKGNTDTFQQLARIRLARIYLMQNKPQKALNILQDVDSKAYLGLVYEVRGDVYVQLKQKEKASQAYQKALALLPPKALHTSLVQMKLSNI